MPTGLLEMLLTQQNITPTLSFHFCILLVVWLPTLVSQPSLLTILPPNHHCSKLLPEPQVTTCPKAVPVFKDNCACVNWSPKLSTKGLCHIQILENTVWESVQNGAVIVKHVTGNLIPADIFTKEDK
eukprot:1055528-Ditylum_brightwellii.AAC.1